MYCPHIYKTALSYSIYDHSSEHDGEKSTLRAIAAIWTLFRTSISVNWAIIWHSAMISGPVGWISNCSHFAPRIGAGSLVARIVSCQMNFVVGENILEVARGNNSGAHDELMFEVDVSNVPQKQSSISPPLFNPFPQILDVLRYKRIGCDGGGNFPHIHPHSEVFMQPKTKARHPGTFREARLTLF